MFSASFLFFANLYVLCSKRLSSQFVGNATRSRVSISKLDKLERHTRDSDKPAPFFTRLITGPRHSIIVMTFSRISVGRDQRAYLWRGLICTWLRAALIQPRGEGWRGKGKRVIRGWLRSLEISRNWYTVVERIRCIIQDDESLFSSTERNVSTDRCLIETKEENTVQRSKFDKIAKKRRQKIVRN